MKFTTGDKVSFEGLEWFVCQAEWVWNGWKFNDDPEYTQRVKLIQLDAKGNILNSITNVRNTEIDELIDSDGWKPQF